MVRRRMMTIGQPIVFAGCMLVAALSWSLVSGVNGADKAGSKAKPQSNGSAKASAKAKSDSSATATDDADHEGGADVDDDVSALVLPAELLGSVKKSSQLQFSQSLRGLLLEGMAADGAAASKRHFEAATLYIPADPRPAYAYGIALLVQKNPNEAVTQFRAAARKTKSPFLPALQAVPWVHLSKNDYKQGLPELIELAAKIEESNGNWPTGHDKVHAAEWLGRVVGYLSGPGKTPDHATQIESTAEKIGKTLSGERKDAFEQGRERAARRHAELKALAARPTADVLDELRQKREETRTAAQSAAGSIKAIEDEIRAIKKPFDQQIADADKDIRANGTKAKKLAQDIPDAEEAIELLSQPQVNAQAVRPSRYYPQGIRVQNENAQQKKAREAQLTKVKQELQQLRSSIDSAKQNVVDAREQREKAKADLKKALADKRIELAESQRVAHDLAVAAKEAERALQSPDSIKSRVTAFDAYVALDPETEKTRLLATLKTP